MNVLAAVVIPPHLPVSGAVRAALALSKAVAELGWSVDVALMSDCSQVEDLGCARLLRRRSSNPLGWTQTVLPDGLRSLLYRSDIPRLIRPGAYDVVHLHNPIPALECRRIAAACRRAGIPYAMSTHGFVEIATLNEAYRLNPAQRLAGQWLIRSPLRWVIRNADRVLALSPHEAPYLTYLGVRDQQIRIVTNGVDEKWFTPPPPKTVLTVSRKFGLPAPDDPSRPLTALFVGNHTRNKGLQVLFDALPRVEGEFLLIVGGKRRPEIDYEGAHARLKASQGMVVTDFLSDEEMRALYGYADVLVFPTLADTLPLVILEAMASSLPVVASRLGGIPFQVDVNSGWLVGPGDPAELAATLTAVGRSRDALPNMGRHARERVAATFRWSAAASAAVKVYRELTTADSDGAPRVNGPANPMNPQK